MAREILPVIEAAISEKNGALTATAKEIFEHPEVGLKEFNSAKVQCEYLSGLGLNVTRNFGGRETAFRTDFSNGGNGPVIGIFSEYDALPQIGHACGHHLITLSALSAFTGIIAAMKEFNLPGSVALIGSPAEEALGGKIDLLRAGVLNDLDFALITHPYFATNTDPGNLAVGRYDVIYHGRAAHASVAPEKGINALDAQNLLFNGISFWRQQLPGTARVHGIITNGGAMPNIIPDYTSSFFYVRSTDNAMQKKLEERFQRIAKGAAMMTDCEVELRKYPNSYSANKAVPALEAAARESLTQAGFKLKPITQKISTDFADVTLICPGVNLMFDVIGDGMEIPLHSEEFKQRASLEFAYNQAMRAGAAVALTAAKVLASPELQDKILKEFQG